MDDLRLWSKEMIEDFIELFKSYPCLWKVKSEDYKNLYIKYNAYEELVQFCKKRGFPDANKDFVTRKWQNLRRSFRKEVKKTRRYKREGRKYYPNLWYYKKLLFTIDQDADATEDFNNGNQSDDETSMSMKEVVNEVDDDTILVEVKPLMSYVSDSSADAAQYPSPPPKRRKKTSEEYLLPEFLDIDSTRLGQDSSKLKELSEFELTGINITKKLTRMDPTQAVYAESIINKVIRKGLLNKLTEVTDLCDNVCERILTVNNMPSQSLM